MNLVRFGPSGAEKPGLIEAGGRLHDLCGVIGDVAGAATSPEGLARLAEIDPDKLPLAPECLRLGPCAAGTGKFICIGLNYADHAEESGMPVPSEPVIFMKATSVICGPDDPIVLPCGGKGTDWEVELAMTNGVSDWEFQIEREGQWTKGKSCDNFGQIGPWPVTPDEIPDPQDLGMLPTVNGAMMQNGLTNAMTYGEAHLVSCGSQFMTPFPGDIISTGTPPGVGLDLKPPRYLKSGNAVELGVEGLGRERQDVIAD